MNRPVLYLLFSLAATPATGADSPAYLWSCEGEVHYAEAVDQKYSVLEECELGMEKFLPSGSRLEVKSGRAMLVDGNTEVKLGPEEIYEVASKVVEEDWKLRDLLSFLLPLPRKALLKGDEQQFLGGFPYLELTAADGPLLPAWEGMAVWRNLPPDRPLALRVSSGDRLVWGPQVLIEPVFDLAELADLGLDHAQLELMIIDSPYLPSEGTLRFPLGRLLSQRGKPVPAVILAEVRLASPEEQAVLDLPFDQTAANEPALVAAAMAVKENRLGTARAIMTAEFGPDLDLVWQQGLSRLEVVGDFATPEPVAPACVAAGDADALWRCFWSYLGPAVVPEIPLVDLPAASRLVDRLGEMEPDGWRAPVAAAQIDLLRARHAVARRELESAETRCGASEHCSATVALLENLVIVDSHSSLSRGMSERSVNNVEPGFFLDLKQHNARLVPAWDAVDPAAELAGGLWRMAADVRWRRGALESLRYHVTPERYAEIAREFRDGILTLGSEGPAGDLLRWSVVPEENPPRLPRELRPAAALLHAEAVLAPNGSFGAADVVPPVDASLFHREGLLSPTMTAMDAERFTRGYEILAYDRGSGNPIAAARRLMLVASAASSLERLDYARRLLDQAELFLAGDDAPAHDRIGLALLRSRLAMRRESGESVEKLRESFDIAVGADSPGRINSVLMTWAELARQVFHHQNRYRDGVAMLDAGVMAATESQFFLPAMEMNVASLQMLNELNLHSQVMRKSGEAQQIAANLGSALKKKNDGILVRVGKGDLPEIATKLTSMGTFNGLKSQLTTEEVTAMANLDGLWSKTDDKIGVWQTTFQRMAEGAQPDTIGLDFADALTVANWRILAATSRSDLQAAEKLAEQTEHSFYKGLFALISGDLGLLDQLEEEIDKYQKLLVAVGSAPTVDGSPVTNQVGTLSAIRQMLFQKRELFFQLSSVVGAERPGSERQGRTRRQLEAWDADELTGQINISRPWRRRHVEAQVLEAERDFPAALESYDALADDMLRLFFAGQYRNLHRQFIRAQEDAYLGSARMIWELSGDGGPLTDLERADAVALQALDRVDELRWLGGERTLYAARSGAQAPLPDLEGVAKRLGERGTLVVVASFGRYRETVVWVYSAEAGLRAQTFVEAGDELRFKEALRLSAGEAPASPTLERITGWLAKEVPADAPVALFANGELRKLGVHLLPIDGMPWPLRNPLTLAPSLRNMAAAQESAMTGQGKVVVGQPLVEDEGDGGDYRSFEDKERLQEFAGDGILLWGPDATVEEVESILTRAALVHLSTHGTVDAIDPSKTGLKLYKGQMLSLDRASRLDLPGSLIVLSACQSSDWGDPSASTVSTLDGIFLARGASTVVSTADAVKPELAELWMDRFYASLDLGKAPIHAAQDAYRAAREHFPDPFDWGAFVVVGSGVGEFK